MNWITEAQVIEAAKQGEEAALDCSILHWLQFATASLEELRECHEEMGPRYIGSDYCALCQYAEASGWKSIPCSNCVLYKLDGLNIKCVDTVWQVAAEAWEDCRLEQFQPLSQQVLNRLLRIKFTSDSIVRKELKPLSHFKVKVVESRIAHRLVYAASEREALDTARTSYACGRFTTALAKSTCHTELTLE